MSREMSRALARNPNIGDAVLHPSSLKGIGRRMRSERKRLGITLEMVATATDHWVSYISEIETSGRRPSVNMLRWLAMAGADVTYILTAQRTAASQSVNSAATPVAEVG